MTIEQLIASGKWKEKLVTENGEVCIIYPADPNAPKISKMKDEFLRGEKHTRNWILVAAVENDS